MNPVEISEKKFEKSKVFGYRTAEVDEFMSQIYQDYDALLKEKEQLEKKVEFLAEKLMEYREQESKLTDVLLEAKKVSDNVIKKAKEKAEAILSEAEQKSNSLKLGLKREVDKQKSILQQLQKETKDFKNKILLLYKSQVDLIATLPASDFVELSGKENELEIEDLLSDNKLNKDIVTSNSDQVGGVANRKNKKMKERTFSISLDENGMPIKIDEDNISDTQNIALKQDIKKISSDHGKGFDDKLGDKKTHKFKEPLKFGENYSVNSKKTKK